VWRSKKNLANSTDPTSARIQALHDCCTVQAIDTVDTESSDLLPHRNALTGPIIALFGENVLDVGDKFGNVFVSHPFACWETCMLD
jgi:hypothetical protein